MIMETKEWKMVYEKPTVNRQQVMLEQGIAIPSPNPRPATGNIEVSGRDDAELGDLWVDVD